MENPFGYFKSNWRIRQGDSLTTYSQFNGVLYYHDGLERTYKEIANNQNSSSITHQIYADDLLILMQANEKGAQMVEVFMKLEKCNGLWLNTKKTRVFVNKFCHNKKMYWKYSQHKWR